MAYYLAEKLHLRPLEILQTWNRPELLVGYGLYLNQESQKRYYEYQNLSAEAKKDYKKQNKGQEPEQFALRFLTYEEIAEAQTKAKALTQEEIDIFRSATGKGYN